MESFQTSLFFFSIYNLILLSSPFTKSSSFSITVFFFRKHTPPGFASSTCRFWWAPCCRSSTLLPAVFSSSPPSWSVQDASPWHHLKATVPACFVFFWVPKTEPKKASIDLNSSNVVRWVVLRVPLQSNPPKICCSSGSWLLSPMTRWLISLYIHFQSWNRKMVSTVFQPVRLGAQAPICAVQRFASRSTCRPQGPTRFNVRQIPQALDSLSPKKRM